MPLPDSVKAALALIEKDKSKVLGLTIGDHKVEPGIYVPRAVLRTSKGYRMAEVGHSTFPGTTDAQSAPEVSFDVTSSPAGATFVAVCLDLDAPFTTLPILGPILHWIQPGLKASTATTGTPTVLTSTETPVASYAGPAPPPGAAPHRYVFLLYEQPSNFDRKTIVPGGAEDVSVWNRMRYDLGALEKKANLGPVLAANYFCSN
ncbi:hypothetical protein VTK73DRAFT_1912 [Phialemonium thermophilum]|uniref:Uncharacterized protein n=1 Tax=Phialemonium thermophilum TaxID=223376 RepID=A0ABR3Y246_9PEZI